MERKIGEIFEYNGEWYQCLPEILICVGCAFKKKTCKKIRGIRGECERASRQTDGVIFKKLEKVGEPYDDCGTILQRFKIYTNVTNVDTKGLELHIYSNNTIGIEIKQTKEDMEEKKLNLKPFDIQKAKEGKPVCTRDGRKARIICWDIKGNFPIAVAVELEEDIEIIYTYPLNGRANPKRNQDNGLDLMMLPEKKEGWVNVYYDRIDGITFSKHPYPSKEEAIKNAGTMSNRVDTVKFFWKE